MAASMWRMNGFCRVAAVVLLLYSLLLTNGAWCQEEATSPFPAVPAADAGAAGDAGTIVPADAGTPADDVTPTINLNVGALISATPPYRLFTVRNLPGSAISDSQEGDKLSGASGTSAVPVFGVNAGDQATDVAVVGSTVDETQAPPRLVQPVVTCVGKEDIAEKNAVKFVAITDDCSSTKQIIQENAAAWCHLENCHLEIFQEGFKVLLASKDAKPSTLAEALQSNALKEKLGVSDVKQPSSSSSSSVFVGILVSGLLAAAAITLGYLKCQRRPDNKEVKLAEEAYPVDQENQGNTLVSVAPLNPPPETQEKPSVNGESPEAAKTEPPPTNGHSTAKTADTEL